MVIELKSAKTHNFGESLDCNLGNKERKVKRGRIKRLDFVTEYTWTTPTSVVTSANSYCEINIDLMASLASL